MTRAVSTAVWWQTGIEDAATVEITKEFADTPLEPAQIVQLAAAWQQGALGLRALHHALRKGEMLPETLHDFDEYQKDLEDNGPAGAFLGRFEDEDDEIDEVA